MALSLKIIPPTISDTDKAIHGGITRNADGTINMNGYLELTAVVPDGVGARMDGTPSKEIELPELVIREVDDEEDADVDDEEDDDEEEDDEDW